MLGNIRSFRAVVTSSLTLRLSLRRGWKSNEAWKVHLWRHQSSPTEVKMWNLMADNSRGRGMEWHVTESATPQSRAQCTTDTFGIPSVIFIYPLETLTANLPEILRSIHIVSKLSQKSNSLKWETWYKNCVTTFQVLLGERITLKQIKNCSLYIVHGNKNVLIQINVSYSYKLNSGTILVQEVTGKHSRACFWLVPGQRGQWLWFTSNGLSQKHQLTVSIPGTTLTSLVFHPRTQCYTPGTVVMCEPSSKIPKWKTLLSCTLPTVTENWEFTGIEYLLYESDGR